MGYLRTVFLWDLNLCHIHTRELRDTIIMVLEYYKIYLSVYHINLL